MTRITKDPEERKNEIVDAARELFMTKGFEETAVSDIVKKIGVAQGTFYYYFESKEHVLDEIMERLVASGVEQIKNIAGDGRLSATQKLIAMFRLFFSLGNEQGSLGEYMHREENALMHQKWMDKTLVQIGPIVSAVIREGMRSGEFNTIYPDEVTEILIHGLSLYFHRHLFEKDRKILRQKVEAVGDLLERVLGARKWSFQLLPEDGEFR